MAERFAAVFLFLVMVCGTPVLKLNIDETELEEILPAITAEDLDLDYDPRTTSKKCMCQGYECLCCDSILVFGKTLSVCLKVTHALGKFTLTLHVSNIQIWNDEISESSVRKLIGKSETVRISGKSGSVTGSGQITFHDIQMTSKNVVSSCVDGNANFESMGRSQSVTFYLGCFTVQAQD
ncbi:hypothetical protein ACJMK2_015284 [Sinanodonta woodiana]|uniref:DUF4773 domain-containing protein n=1 Tax=Sinanodonta woodiana TaxID=1069815 RepID=A0ABD3V5K2_SINWO